MSGCLYWRTCATGRPVFVQTSPGRIHPTPLYFGGPTDRLLQLYQQHRAVEATRQAVLILFNASLNTDLSRPALRQRTPHQACMSTPLPEVQLAVNIRPDLPSLVGNQCLSQYHMGKDEVSLGILLPIEHPSPLRSQD